MKQRRVDFVMRNSFDSCMSQASNENFEAARLPRKMFLGENDENGNKLGYFNVLQA